MGISTLGFVLVGAASFIFLRTVYRLYFHPLSKIPGPKLAAATHLYEFYYYVVRPGMFLFQMEKMHQQYGRCTLPFPSGPALRHPPGPIVRINPREVHVIDPEFYDEIYASSSRKRDQDAKFVSVFGVPDSMVATVGHEHHRFRRGILNEFFSKRSVLGLSELIEERIQKLMRRFEEIQRQQTVVRLDDAFAALTADIITSYCFGRHWGFLEDENFRNDIRRAADDSLKFAHINRFFPWFVRLSRVVSPRAMAILMPGKSALFEFLTSLLDHTMVTTHQNQVSGPDEGLQSKNRTMIAALTHPSIPPEERDYYRLRDETFIVVSAGTETTARALSVASYYIASDNALRDTLRTELKQVMVAPASRVTWPELEKLPYLVRHLYPLTREIFPFY
jgi:cytochrome P450